MNNAIREGITQMPIGLTGTRKVHAVAASTPSSRVAATVILRCERAVAERIPPLRRTTRPGVGAEHRRSPLTALSRRSRSARHGPVVTVFPMPLRERRLRQSCPVSLIFDPHQLVASQTPLSRIPGKLADILAARARPRRTIPPGTQEHRLVVPHQRRGSPSPPAAVSRERRWSAPAAAALPRPLLDAADTTARLLNAGAGRRAADDAVEEAVDHPLSRCCGR